MVPLLTTETFSRALWDGTTAVHRTLPSCQKLELFIREMSTESGGCCGSGSAPALRLQTGHPGRCFVCSCDAQRHRGLGVCHQIPHQGTFNIFHWLHQLHSEVFMTFSCLPSLPPSLLCAPFFMRANSSPLSPDPLKKKRSFLYNLLLIFSLQYLRQLLCRSPAVQIALHRGRSSCQWLTRGARSRVRDFWNLWVGKSAGTCVQFWIRP